MTEQDRKEDHELTTDREKAVRPHPPTEPAAAPGAEQKAEPAEAQPEPDPLEVALKEAAQNRDRWMRAVADLENFKKRSAQERSRLLKYRNEEILRDLLPITDNLERALSHCNEDVKADPLGQGVSMTLKMFMDILKKYGVTEIKSLGETFDPHLHEAIARVPCSEDRQPNQVVEELEKGFMYEDRLLRPAKVVVSTEAQN